MANKRQCFQKKKNIEKSIFQYTPSPAKIIDRIICKHLAKTYSYFCVGLEKEQHKQLIFFTREQQKHLND